MSRCVRDVKSRIYRVSWALRIAFRVMARSSTWPLRETKHTRTLLSFFRVGETGLQRRVLRNRFIRDARLRSGTFTSTSPKITWHYLACQTSFLLAFVSHSSAADLFECWPNDACMFPKLYCVDSDSPSGRWLCILVLVSSTETQVFTN